MIGVTMNFVSIDPDTCNECGECVNVCLWCFSEKDGAIEIDANENNCIRCGHCVAICPTNAITHHKLDMEAFQELGETASIDTSNFVQFIRERRSHRRFKEKKILPEHLETLVDVCRYAPTGDNLQNVEILILQNRKKIQKLSSLVIDHLDKFCKIVGKKMGKIASKGTELTEEDKFTLKTYEMAQRFVKSSKEGLEPVFWGAPAVMIFHSHPAMGSPKDDCVIAAHTVTLTARTMGLESCYIGVLEISSQYYPPIMEELNLPPKNKIFSVLALGYPEQKYLRAVDRRPMKVRWE